jgi:hypothetical protein
MKRMALLAAVVVLSGSVRTARADFMFQSFDVPGAAKGTFAGGLNDSGAIVGYYTDSAGVQHGFLRSPAGAYTTLDPPGAGASGASGIASSGKIVGSYSFTGVSGLGFVLSGGTYTTINVPGSTQTSALGISPSGTIVGSYSNSSGDHGFLLSGADLTTFDYPGPHTIFPIGVNDSGQVVGYLDTSLGFMLDSKGFTTLTVPGSQATFATGINNLGQIVGYYTKGPNIGPTTHGFLLDGSGNYTTFDAPGATGTGTIPFGINNKGQVTGYYFDANGNVHGFLATPVPGPSTLTLAVLGGLTRFGYGWRQGFKV